jgi:predicted DCC family thiol-disulfide oxidoreductase YuxK
MSLRILYDGDCAFCLRSVRILKKLDSFGELQFYNSRDPDGLEKNFPMVKAEDVEEAMVAVTNSGSLFKGFYAFRRLIWTSPWLWLTVPIFYLPGASFFGKRFYAWIARNRNNFGCRSNSCES